MQFNLKLISAKYFFITVFGGIVISFVVFFNLGLFPFISGYNVMLAIMSVAIACFFAAHKIAASSCHVILNESSIKLNDLEIPFNNIAGYFYDDTTPTMQAINLKLVNGGVISLTAQKFGTDGKQFKVFVDSILEKLQANNSRMMELNFADVYVNQVKYLKYSVKFGSIILILGIVVGIYSLLTGRTDFKWGAVVILGFWLLHSLKYLKKGQS